MATHQGRWCRRRSLVSHRKIFSSQPRSSTPSFAFRQPYHHRINMWDFCRREYGVGARGMQSRPKVSSRLLTRFLSSSIVVISLSTITFSTSTTPSISSLPDSPRLMFPTLIDTSPWVVDVKLAKSTSRLKRCKNGSTQTSKHSLRLGLFLHPSTAS